MLSSSGIAKGDDDGWTFNMHEGFVESSDESGEDQGKRKDDNKNDQSSWTHQGSGNSGYYHQANCNNIIIDISESEDSAVFHRNPWSIALLNANTRGRQQQQQRQRNQMLLPTQTSIPVPTFRPQRKEVGHAPKDREKELKSETELFSVGRNNSGRLPSSRKDPPVSRLSESTFPIVKAFQNSKLKPKTVVSAKSCKKGSASPFQVNQPRSIEACGSLGAAILSTREDSKSSRNALVDRLESLSYASRLQPPRAYPSEIPSTSERFSMKLARNDHCPVVQAAKSSTRDLTERGNTPIVKTDGSNRHYSIAKNTSDRLAAFKYFSKPKTEDPDMKLASNGTSGCSGKVLRPSHPDGSDSSALHPLKEGSGRPRLEGSAEHAFHGTPTHAVADFLDGYARVDFPSSEATAIGSSPVKKTSATPVKDFTSSPASSAQPPSGYIDPLSTANRRKPFKRDAYSALKDDAEPVTWSTLPSRSKLSLKTRFGNSQRGKSHFPSLGIPRLAKPSENRVAGSYKPDDKSVCITSHSLSSSRRRLTIYHPPPRAYGDVLEKEINKTPLKIVRAGNGRATMDEDRLQRLLAGRNKSPKQQTPPAAKSPRRRSGSGDKLVARAPQKPRMSMTSQEPSSPSPACHVDLNGLTESYPFMRKILSERKSAAAKAWSALDLQSCGVVWPDTALGAVDAEIAIMSWGEDTYYKLS